MKWHNLSKCGDRCVASYHTLLVMTLLIHAGVKDELNMLSVYEQNLKMTAVLVQTMCKLSVKRKKVNFERHPCR